MAVLTTVSNLNSLVGEMQHRISYDSNGRLLEGNKEYKLHLPSDIPASDLWSIIVYDFRKVKRQNGSANRK